MGMGGPPPTLSHPCYPAAPPPYVHIMALSLLVNKGVLFFFRVIPIHLHHNKKLIFLVWLDVIS
jgi:hypothetical protein